MGKSQSVQDVVLEFLVAQLISSGYHLYQGYRVHLLLFVKTKFWYKYGEIRGM
jgi:hypothetical protein